MGSVDTAVALVTLADTKEYLKISSTSEDSILGFFVNEISKICNSYTGRHLLQKSYTEYYNGNGTPFLILNHYPIISVTSLHDDVNRVFDGSSAIDIGVDVLVKKDIGELELWNSESVFEKDRANVKVVYSAGFVSSAVPYDLQLAVKRWIAIQYYKFTNKRHEVRSETVGDTTTTFIDQQIPDDVKNMLQQHKRVGDAADFAFA